MTEKPPDKGHDNVLKKQIRIGYREFQRSNFNLFLSSFTAGLEVGFSLMLMGVIYTLFAHHTNPDTLKLLVSLGYPLGFLFVIIGKSELFTEETSLAILPVLNGKATYSELLKRWGLVLAGNLIGGLLFALFITWIGKDTGIITEKAFVKIGEKATGGRVLTVMGAAVMAGWLMGLLAWLIASSKDGISQLFIVALITTIIGLAGLPHCIVGSIKLFSSMFVDSSTTFVEFLRFLALSVFGNVIGGAFFVSVLKYSQMENQKNL